MRTKLAVSVFAILMSLAFVIYGQTPGLQPSAAAPEGAAAQRALLD